MIGMAPHRVNRGRIPVLARVGALGTLLSARPHGLGNAFAGRGEFEMGRQRRQWFSFTSATNQPPRALQHHAGQSRSKLSL